MTLMSCSATRVVIVRARPQVVELAQRNPHGGMTRGCAPRNCGSVTTDDAVAPSVQDDGPANDAGVAAEPPFHVDQLITATGGHLGLYPPRHERAAERRARAEHRSGWR
jgi:hypothetical protein